MKKNFCLPGRIKMIRLCVCGAVIVLSFAIQNTFCATSADAKNLKTKLLVTDGYDKEILPLDDQLSIVEVNMSLFLLSINELSETKETLKTTGYLWITWYDDFLQWDSSDYGGIGYYKWPQADIWRPDVALKNSFKEYKELGLSSLNVNVRNDGYIEWYPFEVFETTCSVNIKYYPFDEQECELKFVAWSYSENEVTLNSDSTGIELKEYESNSVWDIIDTSTSVDTSTGVSILAFKIKLKRKPLYVLLSVIMPILMLAILNLFVFLLPSDGGEKAGYAITVFLAFAVFLSIISTMFPVNSEVVAVFSVYLIIQTLQSTMIALIALSLIRFVSYDADNTPVPKYIQSALRMISCIPCRNPKDKNKVFEMNKIQGNGPSSDKLEGIEDPKDESPNDTLYSDYSWKEVVNNLDRIFFVMFGMIFVISTLAFFISASVHN